MPKEIGVLRLTKLLPSLFTNLSSSDGIKAKKHLYICFMKVFGHIITFLLLLFFATSPAQAQEKPKGRKQQQKELRKKKEGQIEKQKQAEKELQKRHLNIQDKATKKRMKRAKKKSDRLNRSKRRRRFN